MTATTTPFAGIPMAQQTMHDVARGMRTCTKHKPRRRLSVGQFEGDSTVCIRCARRVPKKGAKA